MYDDPPKQEEDILLLLASESEQELTPTTGGRKSSLGDQGSAYTCYRSVLLQDVWKNGCHARGGGTMDMFQLISISGLWQGSDNLYPYAGLSWNAHLSWDVYIYHQSHRRSYPEWLEHPAIHPHLPILWGPYDGLGHRSFFICSTSTKHEQFTRCVSPASRVESHDSVVWLQTGVSSGNWPMFVLKSRKYCAHC